MVYIKDNVLGASSTNSAAAVERAKLHIVVRVTLECGRRVEEEGPPAGLPNSGNTCFMNAVLQCLLNVPGGFMGGTSRPGIAVPQSEGCVGRRSQSPKDLLGVRFASLLEEYDSKRGSCLDCSDQAPLGLVRASMADLDAACGNGKQQDAYEFLGWFLEGLDESLAASGMLTEVPISGFARSVCGVTSFSSRRCSRCHTVVEVDRTTGTAIGLPMISAAAQVDEALRRRELESPVGLQDLLHAAQSSEDIEGYDCDYCRSRAEEAGETHSRSTVTQRAGLLACTSEVLVIAPYRFVNALDDANGDFEPIKVRRQVSIPHRLPLATGEYRLHGVVSHCGESLSSGHYISAVRSRHDHRWYECDDSSVAPLRQANSGEAPEFRSAWANADPLICFYHRVSESPR